MAAAVASVIALLALRTRSAAPPTAAPTSSHPPVFEPPIEAAGAPAIAVARDAAVARRERSREEVLVDRILELFAEGGPWDDARQRRLAELDSELIASGARAVPTVIGTLDRIGDGHVAAPVLFHVMRRLPGDLVDARLVDAARAGRQQELRMMAMESLASRKPPQAITTLTQIARTDPDVPTDILVKHPRNPDVVDTELPDERRVTPRMRAVAALAATGEPRAGEVLSDLAKHSSEESVRMESARHLAAFAAQPVAQEALIRAATSDDSPYVRLAAIGSLRNTSGAEVDRALTGLARDHRDAGVRALAQQVLNERAQAGGAP